MTTHLTDQLRAPPDVILEHRQGLLVDQLFVLFERMDQLGKQTTAIEERRDKIGSRLLDPVLLETYPKGTKEHDDALEKRAKLTLLSQQCRAEIYGLAGQFGLKLKRLHVDRFNDFAAQLGSAYKNEPIWNVVQCFDIVQRNRDWQDCIGAMLRADDNRPPF